MFKFDFLQAIEDLKINNKINIENIKNQKDILDSKSMNTSFSEIEKDLNVLYEKSRQIEQLNAYIKSFIKTEVEELTKESSEVIRQIKALKKDNSLYYIKYNINFNNISSTILDRDKTILPLTTLIDGKLTSSTSHVDKIHLNDILIDSKYKNYKYDTNEKKLINGDNYVSIYSFPNKAPNKVSEIVTIKFDTPTAINKINYNEFNCSTEKIEYILEDDSIFEKENKDYFTKNSRVKMIKLYLVSNNYILSNLKPSKNVCIEDVKNEDRDPDKVKYYYCYFGIDNFKLENVQFNKYCGYISNEIDIGSLNKDEYLEILAEHGYNNGSIEYSIIDGSDEIPILIEKENQIHDELIFNNLPTRFELDINKDYVIKKDGVKTAISLEDAKNKYDGVYTISYYPKASNSIKNILKKDIKLKIIIRTYNNKEFPVIKNVTIKKFGGSNIWDI